MGGETIAKHFLAGCIDAFAASDPIPSAAEQKGAQALTTLGGLGNAYFDAGMLWDQVSSHSNMESLTNSNTSLNRSTPTISRGSRSAVTKREWWRPMISR